MGVAFLASVPILGQNKRPTSGADFSLGLVDATTIVPTALAVVAIGCAMFLTHHFNSRDSASRKLIKFLGVLISTMPIVGLIQGAIALRLRAPGYSSACFGQAAVGATVYVVGKSVLKLLSST